MTLLKAMNTLINWVAIKKSIYWKNFNIFTTNQFLSLNDRKVRYLIVISSTTWLTTVGNGSVRLPKKMK